MNGYRPPGWSSRERPDRKPPKKQVLLRLSNYLKPLKWRLLGALGCALLASGAGLGIGASSKFLIDAMQRTAGSGNMTELNLFALLAVVLFFAKALFTYGQQLWMASASQRLAMRLRNQVFAHLQAQSMSFFDSRKTGQLMSSITNDVPTVQTNLTTAVLDIVSAPITVVGGVVILFWLNWQLAALSIVCLPVTAWLIVSSSTRIRRNTRRLQRCLGEVSEIAEESLSGHRAVKAFANEKFEIDRFEQKSESVFRTIMTSVRIRAVMSPLVETIGAVAIVLVLWFGGREIVYSKPNQAAFTVGGLTGFILILKQIADSLRSMGGISLSLSSASAAAERLFNLLDTPAEIQDLPGARPLPRLQGEVSFDHVNFAYRRGVPVLHDVTFTVRPGQMVALVGKSGSGKSTIASLIPRFYEVLEGQITVDGIDIRNATIESLRSQIGIVPQDPHLFGGTVLENIEYGRLGSTVEEVVSAAKAANAHEFISRMPNGYDTIVGERGVRLSGGERQRISIARAILRDPRILILDEATSSLDAHSEALVQDALHRLITDRTTLVIAHRLSTIRHADLILVVDHGRVVECGTHAELQATGGIYAQLYRTQFRHDLLPESLLTAVS